ncbi:MAG: type II toxin-antitoxin system HicB family antitoxin [Spirochaetota bacterium]
MKRFTALVEKDPETSLLVGYIPGLAGAHTQAESLDELHENLEEVLSMLLEDGEPILDSGFAGIQEVVIA